MIGLGEAACAGDVPLGPYPTGGQLAIQPCAASPAHHPGRESCPRGVGLLLWEGCGCPYLFATLLCVSVFGRHSGFPCTVFTL